MSDEQGLDNLDMQHAHKSGPLSPAVRERKQKRFLKEFCESGNIKHSCKVAGISRQTYYDWRDNDTAFKAALDEAEPDVNDTLEFAAYERAVKGVESYVVSMGRVVYEESPVLDKDGKPKTDKDGRVIFKRGKPIIERKYSDSLLTTLLKARMPEKYKERVSQEHSGSIDLMGARDSLLDKLRREVTGEGGSEQATGNTTESHQS